MTLAGKHCLVTGANSGLGFAVSKQLARLGANTILVCRSKEKGEQAKGTVAGVKTVAESYWETLERTVDDQMTAVIHRIGVPTKSEIEDLTKKVEDLTQSVEKLRAKQAPATRRPAAKATKAKAAGAAAKAAPKKK
jgi:poly(hydroxyalkanoate) granule-associated protein